MDHMVVGGSKELSLGDSNDFERQSNLSLSDRLKVFKSSQFDLDAFINSKCRRMAEKELKYLTMYLKDLKKASAEEMRKSVYANYSAFIRTAKEISALEGQLLSLRNLLSAQAAVVHGLADGVHVNSLSPGVQGPSDEELSNNKNSEVTKIETWLNEFLESLEVLLAERRVEEALAALDEAERVVEDANDRGSLKTTMLISLQNAITASRLKLADQLVETVSQSSTKGAERRAVVLISILADVDTRRSVTGYVFTLGGSVLHHTIQILKPAATLSVNPGAAYCTSLSQLVFSTIAQASSDSLAVFGEDTSYTSELVTWAVKETENLGVLVRRQLLTQSAASGNLRAAAHCVQICLGHCALLESQGLSLSPVLLKDFKPLVEQALSANLRRIEQNCAALASSDNWSLTPPSGGGVSQSRLSSSANRFNSMVQDLFEDVEPLETLQLRTPLLEGLVHVFHSYVNTLISAFPASVTEAIQDGLGPSIVKVAETEAQQLALLANALLLSDEFLPRAAAKMLPFNQINRNEEPSRKDIDRQHRVAEQRDWKKRLQKSVDRLRDSFCRQHALELIFTNDGELRLTAHLYTRLDGYAEEPEWFPSSIFQELYMRLSQIAALASEIFVGRERFATLLLIRLTETVILWISDDQTFWEEIEQGTKPLGPYGLQQFYLDMEFVMLFASQGRFLSRNLQQVAKNIIARAIDAVSATGIDPYSSLPEDEWFAEVAQIALKMLTGKANFGNEDREAVSPAASASGRSLTSAFSHGSLTSTNLKSHSSLFSQNMAYQLMFILLTFSIFYPEFVKSISSPPCNSNDLTALHKFKAAISLDTSGRLQKWVGRRCCDWEGIVCKNTTYRVTEINLPGLISTEDFIGQTKMEGVLSPSIMRLTSLEVLDLGGLVSLSGNIPKSVGFHLVNLTKLNLFGNNLSGPIPESIGKLIKLEEIQLQENRFLASIPSSIGSLRNLQRLFLYSNRLSGFMPDTISNLVNLVTLDLHDNALDGLIPEKIGALSSLKALDLSNNRLTGAIPASVNNLTAISTAYFDTNFLQGQIPFPVNPGDMPSLGFLRLQNNQLTGNIPSTFGYLSSLRRLSLANNKLEGPLPSSFGDLSKLSELYLDGNRLSETIPESIGKLSNLILLNLSHNFIQGPLPQEMSTLNNLQILDLSFNLLTLQSIPKWLAELPSLSRILLAGCRIQGEFPEVLRATPSALQELDLSDNSLTGSIPAWVGKLTELYSLNLSRNSLISDIPDTITNLHDLGIIDLHSNNLTGSVEKVFELETRFSGGSLTYVDLSDNSFSSGHEGIGIGSQTGIQLLNLSNNLLKNGLPTSIGKMGSLKTLDFSSNQLTSALPESLGDASLLEILKLQRNHFNGNIPNGYLKLKKLRELDLSDNLLKGQIPIGKPLSGFPSSSYSGNRDLCGKPLPPCKI
uniref:Exocyst complex component EXO84A n=2 Tax=Chenopodium quinoa TaxID=63459 RepID=A0A803MB30_CHEQI